jgi:hypothetical protein
MNLIESGDVSWNDPNASKLLKDAVWGQLPKASGQLRIKKSNKS